MTQAVSPRYHISDPAWIKTPSGDPRGYIQPSELKELWFHTGTVCNLSCSFCLEGSKPGDNRIQPITFEEAKRYIDEALSLGVEKFSFTGGEPFVIPDMVQILDYALDHRPCLVLTNATEPLRNRLKEILAFKEKPNPLNFRVSIDSHIADEHDEFRGKGNFKLSLNVLSYLNKAGFGVSVARISKPEEDTEVVNAAYAEIFDEAGLPKDTHLVVFPDFHNPNASPDVPHITENCMTTYTTEETRNAMMCGFSKMIVKKNGRAGVYACTLVDDDDDYDLGDSLKESLDFRIMLKHHRCFSCFANGASCSER